MSAPGTPTLTATPTVTLVSNDPVKIKLTSNGLSASTATQEDVAKLDLKKTRLNHRKTFMSMVIRSLQIQKTLKLRTMEKWWRRI